MSHRLCTPPGWSRHLQTLLLSSLVLLQVLLTVSHAQITLDGSLGPQGPVTGPHYRIGAELGQVRGNNLFQSFGHFNVHAGESATFTGPKGIANILSRVTGGQPSAINGLLRSEIAGANLYLLNPSGVLFGPNASLNVSGSFHVSTADYVRMADGARFSAHLGQESGLTVASPTAFGFLGNSPTPITIQGSLLRVPAGQTLSVVGGDILIVGRRLRPIDPETLTTTLAAEGGRINIISVASMGEVILSTSGQPHNLQGDSFAHQGRIELSQEAFISTTGTPAGTVFIQSGRLTINNAFIGSNPFPPPQRRLSAPGNTGSILINVGNLTLTGGARIDSGSFSAGNAGTITISATESVVLSGRGSNIFSDAFSSGDAGRVVISTPTLSMDGGAIVTSTSGAGLAGDIMLEVGRLTLTGEGRIDSSTRGAGQGGRIRITATDVVTIAGPGSGLFTEARSRGPGGDIMLHARELRLTEGASISATSIELGNAGNIHLTATERFRSDHSSVTTAATRADGGDIVLTAGSLVQLIDSTITASVGGGPQTVGGNLTINAPFVILEGSQISTNAIAGMGGQIRLNSVFLADPASQVSASSSLGVQGTVNIQTPVTELVWSVAPLPQTMMPATALLSVRCEARAQGGRYSSLALGGRDGLPVDPSGVLPSPLVFDERLVADPAVSGAPPQQTSTARFALLAGQDKALPRLGCPH